MNEGHAPEGGSWEVTEMCSYEEVERARSVELLIIEVEMVEPSMFKKNFFQR